MVELTVPSGNPAPVKKSVEKWVRTISKKPNSVATYATAWKQWNGFLKARGERIDADQLVDEKWRDSQINPRERTGLPETRVVDFHRWLGEKGYAEKTCTTYMGAILGFYRSNGVRLDLSTLGTRGLMVAYTKKENMSFKLAPQQVEKFTAYLPRLRDKALCWILYQSGLDISTVFAFNWSDIAEEMIDIPKTEVTFEDGKVLQIPSIKFEVTREKGGGIQHRSYITNTSIEMLTKYLTDKKGSDFAKKMEWEEPLFKSEIGRRAGERYGAHTYRHLFKEVAPNTGFINVERLKHATRNPLRPACLRGSFADSLRAVRCDPNYIDFWMGHSVAYGGAYSSAERAVYCKFAWLGLEPKGIAMGYEVKYQQILDENRKLQNTIEKLELEKNDLLKRVQVVETQQIGLKDLLRFKQDLKEMVKEHRSIKEEERLNAEATKRVAEWKKRKK